MIGNKEERLGEKARYRASKESTPQDDAKQMFRELDNTFSEIVFLLLQLPFATVLMHSLCSPTMINMSGTVHGALTENISTARMMLLAHSCMGLRKTCSIQHASRYRRAANLVALFKWNLFESSFSSHFLSLVNTVHLSLLNDERVVLVWLSWGAICANVHVNANY